jgi:hypothetical protein
MQKQLKTLCLAAALLFSFYSPNLTAQEIAIPAYETAVPEGPVTTIEFEETTYHFGSIQEGTEVTQVFTFTNTGLEPLILSNARGSCGCTVPKWPMEPIMPGETASITVKFNSKNKKGKRNQKVTITANTTPPQSFLYLTGNVLMDKDTDLSVVEGIKEDPSKTELSPDCFTLYPNPTADLFSLKMAENHYGLPAVISLYSQTGQLMAKREIESIEGAIEFTVAHYPAGNYIAKVQIGNNKTQSQCFIVME